MKSLPVASSGVLGNIGKLYRNLVESPQILRSFEIANEKSQKILDGIKNYMAYGTDEYDETLGQDYISQDISGSTSIPGTEVNIQSYSQTAAMHHSLFDNIKMGIPGGDTPGVIQTVYYDEPYGTWSHYWGQWSATGKITGNETSQFIHLNWQWDENGNIIKDFILVLKLKKNYL